jgi:hypothetical protein
MTSEKRSAFFTPVISIRAPLPNLERTSPSHEGKNAKPASAALHTSPTQMDAAHQLIFHYIQHGLTVRKKQSSPDTRHGGAWRKRYSSYSYLTSALDGSGQRHAPAALYPREGPPVPIVQEAGWAPEPVWTEVRRKFLCLRRGSNVGRPVRSQTLYCLSHLGSSGNAYDKLSAVNTTVQRFHGVY